MIDSRKRKESNRRKHAKAGAVPVVAQAETIVAEKHE